MILDPRIVSTSNVEGAVTLDAQLASISDAELEKVPDYMQQTPVTPVAVVDKSIPLKDIIGVPKLSQLKNKQTSRKKNIQLY